MIEKAPNQELVERIALRLKALKPKGVTERGVSMKATGKPDTLRNIRRGGSFSPRGETFKSIAKELGCTVAYLMGETEELSRDINSSLTSVTENAAQDDRISSQTGPTEETINERMQLLEAVDRLPDSLLPLAKSLINRLAGMRSTKGSSVRPRKRQRTS